MLLAKAFTVGLLLAAPLAAADTPGTLTSSEIAAYFAEDLSAQSLSTRGASHYSDLAKRLEGQGKDLSAIFKELTALALKRGNRSWMGHRFEVTNLFSGMVRWTEAGGAPAFQGRQDLALHFIHGSFLAGRLGPAVADRVAYEKEKKDSKEAGNFFDLDDLGATYLGVRWFKSIGQRQRDIKNWLGQWGSGKRSLAALPALKFGRLAKGRLPSGGRVAEVKGFADQAMKGSLALPASFSLEGLISAGALPR